MTKHIRGQDERQRYPLKRINSNKRNLLVKPTPIYPRNQRKPCELFSPASIIEQENKENLLLKPNKIVVKNEEKELIPLNTIGNQLHQNTIYPIRLQTYPLLPEHSDMIPPQLPCHSIRQTTSQVINVLT